MRALVIREFRVEIVEGRVVCYSISGSKGSLFHYGLTGLFCCIVVKRLQMPSGPGEKGW